MKTTITTLLLLFTCLVFNSCKKSLTDAEKNAIILQDFIEENEVDRVVTFTDDKDFDNTSFIGGWGSDYSFEDGILITDNTSIEYWNLGVMIKYETKDYKSGSETIRFLGVYF